MAVSQKSKETDRLEGLLADLSAHALTGDQVAARSVVDKLLQGTVSGPLVGPGLAKKLARIVRDFDVTPNQRLTTRRGAVVRRPLQAPPANVLSVQQPSIPSLVLPPAVGSRLDQLVLERARASDLAAAGLLPTSRVLLTGPPGVGKTLSATWLAASLGLPLARVEPAWVMSSLLGESARNLRQAFDWSRQVPCVLLIDEFDAFAKKRDDYTDVGELKRLVNMLLLELDNWPASSLLVAATNHPQLLDVAMQRRFEVVLDLPLPNAVARERIVEEFVARHAQVLDEGAIRLLVSLSEGRSGADLNTLLQDALRHSVLYADPLAKVLVSRMRPPMGRDRVQTRQRALYCFIAHDIAGLSNRRIAADLGITNASVSELVRAGRLAADDAAADTAD